MDSENGLRYGTKSIQSEASYMEETFASGMKGQFLMAMPGLNDPNFAKTVTCISEHTEQGAVGIVINRVHFSINAFDICHELNIECRSDLQKVPVHIGGPVNGNEIFVLHGPPFGWEGCLMITSDIALSNTLDILTAIAAGNGPEAYLISLGCAGWGPAQLEEEIMQNAWLTSPLSADIVFQVPVEKRWEAAVKAMGIDPVLLSDSVGHA